jgi:hypothetical protein
LVERTVISSQTIYGQSLLRSEHLEIYSRKLRMGLNASGGRKSSPGTSVYKTR